MSSVEGGPQVNASKMPDKIRRAAELALEKLGTAALAQAQAVYAARPTIYAADLLSRALWRAGDIERTRSHKARAIPRLCASERTKR